MKQENSLRHILLVEAHAAQTPLPSASATLERMIRTLAVTHLRSARIYLVSFEGKKGKLEFAVPQDDFAFYSASEKDNAFVARKVLRGMAQADGASLEFATAPSPGITFLSTNTKMILAVMVASSLFSLFVGPRLKATSFLLLSVGSWALCLLADARGWPKWSALLAGYLLGNTIMVSGMPFIFGLSLAVLLFFAGWLNPWKFSFLHFLVFLTGGLMALKFSIHESPVPGGFLQPSSKFLLALMTLEALTFWFAGTHSALELLTPAFLVLVFSAIIKQGIFGWGEAFALATFVLGFMMIFFWRMQWLTRQIRPR